MDGFAKALDKKMPNLATRDDLAKLEARIEAKMGMRKSVISTNVPVDKRIEMLEKRVGELVQSLRGFRSPFVID